MLTPSLNTVMTRLLIVAAVLATLALFVPAVFAQQAGEPIMYDENATSTVIIFTSTDPENGTAGAGIDWDVTGIDADDFTIDSRGMLMFNSPPDSEEPTDRPHAARDLTGDGDTDDADDLAEATVADNMYQITVRATEQSTSGSDPRALSTESHVTIQVVDVNESGDITLNRIQPEVGTAITATLTDPDGTDGDGNADVSWQWYVSKVIDPVASFDSHWDTVGANPTGTDASSTYTPAGDRVDGITGITDPGREIDEGKYLLAIATYSDRLGSPRTARVMSENPVRKEVSSDTDGIENPTNGSPGFDSTGDYKRSIYESDAKGSPVGDPVEATDPNSDDELTYELDDDDNDDAAEMTVESAGTTYPNDLSFFSVDDGTGQISLRKQLSFENTDRRDYEGDDAVTAGTYKFYA